MAGDTLIELDLDSDKTVVLDLNASDLNALDLAAEQPLVLDFDTFGHAVADRDEVSFSLDSILEQ